MKQVRVYDDVHTMLVEIVEARKKSGSPHANKQQVANDLIMKAHKKEVKHVSRLDKTTQTAS